VKRGMVRLPRFHQKTLRGRFYPLACLAPPVAWVAWVVERRPSEGAWRQSHALRVRATRACLSPEALTTVAAAAPGLGLADRAACPRRSQGAPIDVTTGDSG